MTFNIYQLAWHLNIIIIPIFIYKKSIGCFSHLEVAHTPNKNFFRLGPHLNFRKYGHHMLRHELGNERGV